MIATAIAGFLHPLGCVVRDTRAGKPEIRPDLGV